jgi:hypothetical protein
VTPSCDKLEALHGDKTGEQILTDLCKWMDANGNVATLRHGFKCYGRTKREGIWQDRLSQAVVPRRVGSAMLGVPETPGCALAYSAR